jgi:hypothetical protein
MFDDAPAARPLTATTLRTLGLVGVLGSPMMLLTGLHQGFTPAEDDAWTAAAGILYMAAVACCAIGLRRLRATGDGWPARILAGAQVAMACVAACWSAAAVLAPPSTRDSALFHLGDLAWPLSHLLMLVTGVMVLVTRRLRGWTRFGGLVSGLALPAFLALAAAGLRLPGAVAFGVMTCLGLFAQARSVLDGAHVTDEGGGAIVSDLVGG